MDQPNKEKISTAEQLELRNPKQKNTQIQNERLRARDLESPSEEHVSQSKKKNRSAGSLMHRSPTPNAQELYHRPPKARDNPPTDRDLTSASHLKLLVHVPKSNDCRRPPCSPRHSPLLQASSSPLDRLSHSPPTTPCTIPFTTTLR
jgi:hypothetical protein